MSTPEKVEVSLDDILDGTLDDLQDLPEWKPFPAGAHRCVVSFETVKVPNPTVKVKLVAVETVELANPAADSPLEKGAEVVIQYTLNNEFGQGSFKKLMAYFREHLDLPPETKNGEILKAAQGMEAIFFTQINESKKNKGQKFTQISEVGFV